MYTRPIIDAVYDIQPCSRKVIIMRGVVPTNGFPTLSKDPLFTLRWEVSAKAMHAKKFHVGTPTTLKRTLRGVKSLRQDERKLRTVYASQKLYTGCSVPIPPIYRRTKALPRHVRRFAHLQPCSWPHSLSSSVDIDMDVSCRDDTIQRVHLMICM